MSEQSQTSFQLAYMRGALRLHAMRGVPEAIDKMSGEAVFETFAALKADEGYIDSFKNFLVLVKPPQQTPQDVLPPEPVGKVVAKAKQPDPVDGHEGPHITGDGFNASAVTGLTPEQQRRKNEAGLMALEILTQGMGAKSPIKVEIKKKVRAPKVTKLNVKKE